MSQTLKPKIKYISYSVDGEDRRQKVKLYGNVREELLKTIETTLIFLPDTFKNYLYLVDSFEIRKGRSGESTGVFNNGDYSLKIYDFPTRQLHDYSETFLHELAHLIFFQYVMWSEDIKKGAGNDPIEQFVKDIKEYKIKPITEYLKDLEVDEKFRKKEYDYPNELFAGYLAFTYSRYCDETEAKGTFCNYLKLRNLFWFLVDEVETSEFNPFNQD